jgi:hypothetical protein
MASVRQEETMKNWTLVAFSFLISITTCAQVIHNESEGNLKSDKVVILKEVNDIRNIHNPVDIFPLVRAKIKQKQYDQAAIAYLIAYTYGVYDSYRVEDKTAHQAVMVLGNKAIGDLSKSQLGKFQEALQLLMKDKEKVLSTLTKLGKPNYYPKYMIQHGMGAFLGNKSKDGLVSDFDPDKAWKDTLVIIFPKE